MINRKNRCEESIANAEQNAISYKIIQNTYLS